MRIRFARKQREQGVDAVPDVHDESLKIERELEKRLATRGLKAFRQVPTAEALIIFRRRPTKGQEHMGIAPAQVSTR